MGPAQVDFIGSLLGSLGAPDTPSNRQFLQAWIRAEGSRGANNPLATTKRGYPGERSINRAGVKSYPSPEVGVQATADTLRLRHYRPIVAGLAAGNTDPRALASNVVRSPWGTGTAIMRILNAVVPAVQAADTVSVRLPDGRVLRGIPKGTTKAQVIAKLKANGVQVPDAWMQASPQLESPELRKSHRQRQAPAGSPAPTAATPFGIKAGMMKGVGETALSMGSGLAGDVAGGLAGLLALAPLGSDKAADLVTSIKQAMSYQPRTQAGQRITQIAAIPTELLGRAGGWAGEKTRQFTGSPGAATAVQTAIQGAPLLVGGGGLLRPRGALTRAAMPEPAARIMAVNAAQAAGLDWSALDKGMQDALISVVREAGHTAQMTPEMAVRAARLRALPVPTQATRGQLTRDAVQLREETQASQTHAGAPLRERYIEQNRALLASLDVLKGRTKATARTPEDVGRAIVDSRLKGLEARSDANVNALYERARAEGEMQAPVDSQALVDYVSTHPDPPMVSYVLAKLRSFKTYKVDKNDNYAGTVSALYRDEHGNLRLNRPMTLEELHTIRKAAVAAGKDGGTRGHYAGEVKKVIDQVTENSGGPLYREAREAYIKHRRTFDDPEAISQILGRTKAGDRKTALEDVWRRTVIGGSLEDLTRVKRTLLTGPGLRAGIASWREVQGATIDYLTREATKSAALDEVGMPNLSAAGLKRAYDRIGPQKMQAIFGRKMAGELDNLLRASQDIKTLPPRRIAGSDTSINLINFMHRLTSHLPRVLGAAQIWRELREKGAAARTVKQAVQPLGGVPLEAARATRRAETLKRLQPPFAGAALAAPSQPQDHADLIRQLSRALANPYGPAETP